MAFLGNSDSVSLNPRLSVDFVLGRGFTVGAEFMYGSKGGESTTKDASSGSSSREVKEKDPKYSAFAIGARGGYVYMFNDTVGIWPMLGLSYRTATRTSYLTSGVSSLVTEFEHNVHGVVVQPAALLVISPVQHFAVTLGVAGSIAASGGYTYKSDGTTEEEGDVSGGSLGLAAGLLGYL